VKIILQAYLFDLNHLTICWGNHCHHQRHWHRCS